MENNLQETKSLLIEALKEKQENGILEKSNVKLLEKLINNAETIKEAEAIAGLGTIYKRTGFHFDHRLETDGNDIKYFVKNEELSFVTNKDAKTHKLIIGDNYDALLNLLITHKGVIDVIYIDPPYGKDSMGEFAKTNYTNSLTRDNLLSMLLPRLQLAKLLLSKEGAIFISIDNRNQAYIKLLLDEVFGEINFVNQITIINNESGRSDDKFFATSCEYLFCYAKDINSFSIVGYQLSKEDLKEYKFKDEFGYYKKSNLKKTGKESRRTDRPDMYYPIYWNEENNTFSDKRNDESDIEILPEMNEDGTEGRWRWGKGENGKFSVYNTSEYLLCEKIGNNYKIKVKDRPDVDGYGKPRTKKPKTHWSNPAYATTAGSNMFKSIGFKKDEFDSPKPVQFIKDIIKLIPNKDINVLDFFAGSGTTGQAVLDLNREDGGSRKFILCTINEETKENPNGIAYDITAKRCKRTMTGECYDGKKDFKWIEKNEPYGDNLDVLEIATINNSIQEKNKTPFDVIDETLYDLPKFDSIEEKISWVCRNFDITQNNIESDEEWFKRIQKGE